MHNVQKILAVLVVMLAVCGFGARSSVAMDASDAPETVEIGVLADLYEKVDFGHSLHVEAIGGDCAVCHHHTTGGRPADPKCARCHADSKPAETVACRDCHALKPFDAEHIGRMAVRAEIYHVDKPGLKGAYHLSCMGCHQEVGGPSGCQDCHARTEAGEKLFHAGRFAPSGDHGERAH